MSALTVDHTPDHDREWDDTVRIWEQTDAPEGCKVEIIEGIVTVSPPPDGMHNAIADELAESLYAGKPKEWGIYQTLGVAVPSRRGMYVPDLVIAPKQLVRNDSGGCLPAAACELLVEITSRSNAAHDRISKAAGYARAGAPLYLLIDRWAPAGPTITLFGEPKNEVYRTLSMVKFGEPLDLPEPFGLTLDTSSFLPD
ncbi:Uma2 family endonuclease [Streptomyces catenulae]|uniref:Uma2 family endonuclease n=1 Tax=Streptomyces catenulae TaxID=66875 RepID=A0ABV2YTW5_9ACTN|nr:Uma2 family endonuclease [Streptomyces catenulae]